MARSVATIKAELDRLFPPEWSDNPIGNAIVTGIATVLAGRESAFDSVGGWLEQMFRGTAVSFWLDEHGKDYGVERLPGELDDDYRVRQGFQPGILTRGNARARFSNLLPGEGYEVVIEEPHRNVLDDGFFLGDTSSILVDPRGELGEATPKFVFWVFVPLPEVEFVHEAFLNVDCFLGVDAYLDEKIDDLNRRHIRQILELAREQRGYGIGFGVTVADLDQTVYFDFLHGLQSGGYV